MLEEKHWANIEIRICLFLFPFPLGESVDGDHITLLTRIFRRRGLHSKFCAGKIPWPGAGFEPLGSVDRRDARIALDVDRNPVAADPCGLALPGILDCARLGETAREKCPGAPDAKLIGTR